MDTARQIETQGFAVVHQVLPGPAIERLTQAVEQARCSDSDAAVANQSGVYGLRNLADIVPQVVDLAESATLQQLIRPLFEQSPFLVRATLFDKTPGANWGVFWHRDLSIAVRQRKDLPGYHGWTRKASVPCVQPPLSVMQRLRTVRVHLDDCDERRGALKVLPGSHLLQELTDAEVRDQVAGTSHVVCSAKAGDAVLMVPTLLHASSPMEEGEHRRVIHLEFADFELPRPLSWHHTNHPALATGSGFDR